MRVQQTSGWRRSFLIRQYAAHTRRFVAVDGDHDDLMERERERRKKEGERERKRCERSVNANCSIGVRVRERARVK